MNEKTNKQKYTFIESGWFTATSFAFGALIGIMLGTNFFSNLGTMDNTQVFMTVFLTLAGAVGGVLLAVNVRKVL